MTGTPAPFEDRRHDDKLASYRMEKLESNVDGLIKSLSEFREGVSREFAQFRKELFENPIFVTIELMKLELESRDRQIQRLERDHENDMTEIKNNIGLAADKATSTRRWAISICIAFMAVLVSLAGLVLAKV